MRILVVSVAIGLMMVPAHAQDMNKDMGKDMGKARKHQHAQKTENTTKSKADEQAYKEALKRIPDSTKKVDPWQSVR
jgi:Sec-independent protein translocase protein TatA